MFKNKSILLVVLISGFLIGFFVEPMFIDHNNSCVSKLNFIKPNLDCDSYESKIETLGVLEDKITTSIQSFEKTNKVKRISVFVRDLNSSRFMGVNDADIYYMASLLKTSLLIGGFKLAEVEPLVLEQEIVYTGKPNLNNGQIIKVEDELKVGQSYTIKDLMRRSVIYSDNTSAQILFEYYPTELIDRIQQAIGVQLTKPTGETENLITAKTYANVFRILYNASYLTKEYSNEALSILTQTTFKNGARAKLPAEITVAHKFAERTFVDSKNQNKTIKQLHDCGIVYKKNNPYVFCIMTEGDNYEDLEKVIGDISLLIYDEMVKKD